MFNVPRLKQFIVIPALAACFALPAGRAKAQAQAADADTQKQWVSPAFSPKVGNLYLLAGAGFNDLDGINGRLDDAGYSELAMPTLTLGVGADMSVGRLIIGGEWQWLKNVGAEAERDDLRADVSTKYWLFRLGVDLAKWRGLRVYPLIGIGTGTTKFTVASEAGDSFDDALDTPTRDLRLSQRALLLDASLGIDYRFKIRETETKSSFFTAGLRGGYLFAPYSRGWETPSAEISGGPDFIASGPTVQLLLGFSGERKKPWWRQHGATEKR